MTYTCRTLLSAVAALSVSASAFAVERLTIEDAVRIARERNETVGAAQQRLEAADARVSRARAFFFPDLTVNSSLTHRDPPLDIDGVESRRSTNSTANFNSVLFNARAFPLYRQARLERESQQFTTAETTRIVGFEAADAFLQTLSAEQVMHATERRLEFARTSLADARARFDSGLVSSNDVTKAELELASAELDLSRARANAQNAYLELGNLLNVEVEPPLMEPSQLLSTAGGGLPDAAALSVAAAQNRLDLAASRARISALRAFSEEPTARFIPSLNLNGQLRVRDDGGLDGSVDDNSVSLNLAWTPWDGGEALAERAERRAAVREAELGLQQVTRAVETDIRQSVSTLASEQAAISQAATAVSAARRNFNETTELYRQGLASALELADATTRLFEAEVAEARARYQLGLAFLDVRAAAGLEPLSELPAAVPAEQGATE